MEQMEILLSVPTVSKPTVSSTPKATGANDDQSFADLYEQNINGSKSSNSETTQKSSKKNNESVENSVKSETKVENKTNENEAAKTETTEEDGEQKIVAANWLTILDIVADSTNEENSENVSEASVPVSTNEEAQMVAAKVDTQSIPENSINNGINGEMEGDVPAEMADLSENTTDKGTTRIIDPGNTALAPTATVSTNVSEATIADGITEETNESEIVENTVQNEVVAKTTNEATNQTTVTTNVATTQSAEATNVNSDFSTMMSDNISKSNLQESVMTQIENSLGKVVKTGNNEIRIQLEPEQLGVLNIRIIAGKDGTQVVFKADSHQSSQLIAGQTETLKTMLNEAGIKVDQIVVNDFSFSQDNYQDQQTFEQQNGKNNKFYKGTTNADGQLETYDAGYDLPQTVVGLNYLI